MSTLPKALICACEHFAEAGDASIFLKRKNYITEHYMRKLDSSGYRKDL
jgi:hypothetical protein